jgi:hypothetical protein
MIWFLAAMKAIEWLCAEPIRILYIIGGYLLIIFICALIPNMSLAVMSSVIGGPLTQIVLDTLQKEKGWFLFLGEVSMKEAFIIYILCAWLILEIIHLPERISLSRQRKKEHTTAITPGFIPNNTDPDYNYSLSYGYKIPIGFHSTAVQDTGNRRRGKKRCE